MIRRTYQPPHFLDNSRSLNDRVKTFTDYWDRFFNYTRDFFNELEAESAVFGDTAAHIAGTNRFRYLNSAARAYKAVAQSIPYGAVTALTFDLESFDTDNIHSATVNPSRFTAPIAGKYLAIGGAAFIGGVGGLRLLRIMVNGSAGYIAESRTPATGAGDLLSVSSLTGLAAGDYVEFAVYQDQTSAAALNTGSGPSTFGSLAYMGE